MILTSLTTGGAQGIAMLTACRALKKVMATRLSDLSSTCLSTIHSLQYLGAFDTHLSKDELDERSYLHQIEMNLQHEEMLKQYAVTTESIQQQQKWSELEQEMDQLDRNMMHFERNMEQQEEEAAQRKSKYDGDSLGNGLDSDEYGKYSGKKRSRITGDDDDDDNDNDDSDSENQDGIADDDDDDDDNESDEWSSEEEAGDMGLFSSKSIAIDAKAKSRSISKAAKSQTVTSYQGENALEDDFDEDHYAKKGAGNPLDDLVSVDQEMRSNGGGFGSFGGSRGNATRGRGRGRGGGSSGDRGDSRSHRGRGGGRGGHGNRGGRGGHGDRPRGRQFGSTFGQSR